MTFALLNDYADVILSRLFDTQTLNCTLPSDVIDDLRLVGMEYFNNDMSTEAYQLWLTSLLGHPIRKINKIVTESTDRIKELRLSQEVTGSDVESIISQIDTPDLQMFSAHDSTIVPLWKFMDSTGFDPQGVPYASYVQLRLAYSQDCLVTESTDLN